MKTIIIHDFITYQSLNKSDMLIRHINPVYRTGRINVLQYNHVLHEFLKEHKISFTVKSI